MVKRVADVFCNFFGLCVTKLIKYRMKFIVFLNYGNY